MAKETLVEFSKPGGIEADPQILAELEGFKKDTLDIQNEFLKGVEEAQQEEKADFSKEFQSVFELIKAGEVDNALSVLEKIPKEYLSTEIVYKLIELGQTGSVLSNHDKFTGLVLDQEFLTTRSQKLAEGLMPVKQLELFDSGKEAFQQLPWIGGLKQLLKIQARSKNEDHDPWIKDFNPLVKILIEDGTLSYAKKEDCERLIDFIKDNGMVNTPIFFKIFDELKRAKTLDDLSSDKMDLIREYLGPKADQLKTPDALLNEIKKQTRVMQSRILTDVISQELAIQLDSVLGAELFQKMRGTTQWERGSSLKTVIEKINEFAEANPDKAKIPEGYREVVISVSKQAETKDADLEQNIIKAQKEVLTNPDVGRIYETYAKTFAQIHNPKNTMEGLAVLRQSLESKLESTKANLEKVPERAKVGIQKNIDRLTEQLIKLDSLPSLEGENVNYREWMDGFSDLGIKSVEATELLRNISAKDIYSQATQGFKDIMDRIGTTELSISSLKTVDNLIRSYVLEHALNKQNNHEEGAEAYKKELLTALIGAWQVNKGGADNLLLQAVDKISRLEESGGKSLDKMDIALVPAQGLMRVFSGDVGDACYSSKHSELAEGQYPDLHSYILVTNRNQPANERMYGSVLFVETKGVDGQPTLVVRANNPQEGLLQTVDAVDLVDNLVKEAIKVAKARGMTRVVVPWDNASQASTNRPVVAQAYRKLFPDAGDKKSS